MCPFFMGRIRSGLLARALAGSLFAPSFNAAAQCLYSDNLSSAKTSASDEEKRCVGQGDPAGLATDPEIRKVIQALRLENLQIRFRGCEKGVFGAGVVGARAESYQISYPLLPATPQGSKGNERTRYLAPITHELAHVLQFELNGGFAALRNGRPLLSIELAADFISGIAFDRVGARSALNEFHQNMALVGLYKESPEDAHGTWEQRTWAFRRGVFWSSVASPLPPRDADNQFVKKLFREAQDLSNPVTRPGAAQLQHLPRALSLNKISACAEVDQLYNALRVAKRPLDSCRAPHSALEKALSENFTKGFGPREVCFLSSPPSQIFTGYSCFQLKTAPDSIACIRPIHHEAVSAHFADATLESSRQYREQAAACGADASVSLASTFSPMLHQLFNFEFGFLRSLGGSINAPGQMHHGAASTKRADRTGGTEIIEFITLFAKGQRPRAPDELAKKVGVWQVEVEKLDDLAKQIEAMVRKRSRSIAVGMMDISVKRLENAPAPQLTRETQVQQWQQAIGRYLETELFEQIPDSELRTPEGKDIYTTMRELRDSGDFPAGTMSPHMLAYKSQSGPGCTGERNGILVGMTFATEIPSEQNDYGSFSLMVFGIGDCAKKRIPTRRYIDELLENASNTIMNLLEERR